MKSDSERDSKSLSAVLRVAKILIILISILMLVVTFAQVIFRYLLATPLPWSEELARYCFVWIVFLGGAIGLSRGFHLGVDLLVNTLPKRLQRGLDLLVSALIACFAGAIIYASFPVISMNTQQRSPALGVQMSWIYIAIPISMFLIVLISIERIVNILRAHSRRGD